MARMTAVVRCLAPVCRSAKVSNSAPKWWRPYRRRWSAGWCPVRKLRNWSFRSSRAQKAAPALPPAPGVSSSTPNQDASGLLKDEARLAV